MMKNDQLPERIQEFLHDEDIAALFKVTVRVLQNKVEAGDPLPPRSQPPGMRVRLWPRKAVEAWVLKFLQPGGVVDFHVENPVPARGRGRPPKFPRRDK
ncbi:MAG: hypothetical protein ACLGHE_10595 [Gammaproteobacteria bacterium]